MPRQPDVALPFFALGRDRKSPTDDLLLIERLLDSIAHKLAPDKDAFWRGVFRRHFSRRSVDRSPLTRPRIDVGKLEQAWSLLLEKHWLSLQRIGEPRRLQSLRALTGLSQLETLVLNDNAVCDLSPLASLAALTELNAFQNCIRDLTPLCACRRLASLTLSGNPIADFAPLAELPELRKLSIAVDQVPVFSRCPPLATLERLEICGDGFIASLERLPEMPALRTIRVHEVGDLRGLERYTRLLNVDAWGHFDSLAPLSALAEITHLSVRTDRPLDASPLQRLFAARDIFLGSPAVAQLAILHRLPVLHDLSAGTDGAEPSGLDAVRAGLSSWDDEFRAAHARNHPSATLRIVSQAEFDHFDSKVPYGIGSQDNNPAMLRSERDWIEGQISNALAFEFKPEEDFVIPYRGHLRRSTTLMLYTLPAFTAFREIVRRVQTVLGEARNDWIIYFQSELSESGAEAPEGMADFIVWIYPDHIQATPEHAPTIERLLSG